MLTLGDWVTYVLAVLIFAWGPVAVFAFEQHWAVMVTQAMYSGILAAWTWHGRRMFRSGRRLGVSEGRLEITMAWTDHTLEQMNERAELYRRLYGRSGVD